MARIKKSFKSRNKGHKAKVLRNRKVRSKQSADRRKSRTSKRVPKTGGLFGS